MNKHDEFVKFLTLWLQWAEENQDNKIVGDHPIFRNTGLCIMWSTHFVKLQHLPVALLNEWDNYPNEVFKAEGLDTFNDDPFGWYNRRCTTPSHKWEPRLQWVRQYLAKQNQGEKK